jgi:predicted DsbA family dithiol-disulfide isomerase
MSLLRNCFGIRSSSCIEVDDYYTDIHKQFQQLTLMYKKCQDMLEKCNAVQKRCYDMHRECEDMHKRYQEMNDELNFVVDSDMMDMVR